MIQDVIEAVDELRRRLEETYEIEDPGIRPSTDEQVQILHGPFAMPTPSDDLELGGPGAAGPASDRTARARCH